MTAGSAFWIAAVRARETERQDRLFADPWARDLAGQHGFTVMAASERASGRENSTWCERNGTPPPFGTNDPVALFAAGGWPLGHVTAPGAPDASYGRLPPRPGGVIPGRTHLVTGQLKARG